MSVLLPGKDDPPRRVIHCDMTGIANCKACGTHYRPKADEVFCRECLYWQQFMPKVVPR